MVYQYQENEQVSLILMNSLNTKTTMTYAVGKSRSGVGQANNVGVLLRQIISLLRVQYRQFFGISVSQMTTDVFHLS
jgi:hypothetical protein